MMRVLRAGIVSEVVLVAWQLNYSFQMCMPHAAEL